MFTYEDTAVITPNSDTPYSLMEADLRAEPTVISVPAVAKPRYYSVQLTDANTFNYGYIGSRSTGTEAGGYMVVGPDWKGEAPPQIKQVFHSTTPFTVIIFRTQLFGASDMPNVVKIQAGYKVQPRSSFLKQPAPPAPPTINYLKADAEIAKKEFWEVLDFALQYSPAGPEEVGIRAKLASIGVGPGKKFDMKDLSLVHKAEVLLGNEGGQRRGRQIHRKRRKGNQWLERRLVLRRSRLLQRGLAKAGGCGQGREFSATAQSRRCIRMTRVQSDGKPMDGSKHNYTLTFAKGELPPVNAFWSVTMYDGKTQFLIKNPINRYLINSPMLPGMKTNPDGSVDSLYPERLTGRGQGIKLAACARRDDLPGDAAVLAEGDATIDSAGRRRLLETACDCASRLDVTVLPGSLVLALFFCRACKVALSVNCSGRRSGSASYRKSLELPGTKQSSKTMMPIQEFSKAS